MIDDWFIHSATVETGETLGLTDDDFGVKTTTKTTVTSACRFVNPKGGVKVSESGERFRALPRCLLPATLTTVKEGMKITGLSSGFTKTYKIVNPPLMVYAGDDISHISCDLEAVT